MLGTVENTAEIRSLNRKKIIHYLRKHPYETRRQISDGLGLSFATVSNLTSQMVAEGVLLSESSEKSEGGRIPGLISINPTACCALCIDLARQEKMAIALLNLKGEAVASTLVTDMGNYSYEEMLDICHSAALELTASIGRTIDQLIGIGLSVPGIWDLQNKVLVNSTYARLEGRPLCTDFEKHFAPLRCYIGNEANLMAVATAQISAVPEPLHNLIYLYVDEGLGIGIITGGRLLLGANGFGAEISHWDLEGMRGYPCSCGRKGCLETELSTKGFITKFCEEANQQEACTWETFVQHAKHGHPAALRVIEENGGLLARVIASLNALFAPEGYWIGGSMIDIYREILPVTQTALQSRSCFLSDVPIHCSDAHQTLTQIGCEQMVFDAWRP